MQTYKIGDLFCDEKHDEVYILAGIAECTVTAICLTGVPSGIGVRWNEGIDVNIQQSITQEELNEIIPDYRFKQIDTQYLVEKLMEKHG